MNGHVSGKWTLTQVSVRSWNLVRASIGQVKYTPWEMTSKKDKGRKRPGGEHYGQLRLHAQHGRNHVNPTFEKNVLKVKH